MPNDYYNHGSWPATGAPGQSAPARAELDGITSGFNKLPTITGNGNKAVVVNSSGTALSVTVGTFALAVDLATAGSGGIILRSTGATDVTLPTTGTLATRAGSEALTNKTINGLTVTTSSGTLTITNGKTFAVSNTLTFTGTDGSTVAFGAGGTVLYANTVDAKGDLIVGTADNTVDRLAVGSDRQILVADSSQSGGLKWQAGIPGTTTDDNASGGCVGEYVASVVSTPSNFPSSTQYGDLTSISLTAGDWDVTAQVEASLNGATYIGDNAIGVSLTSGDSSSGLVVGDNLMRFPIPLSTGDTSVTISNYRVSVSATTNVYLKYVANYSTGNPQARGRLSARRAR